MQNWIIEDYEKRCFNLLVRLGRVDLEKQHKTNNLIRLETKRIMKSEKCDRFTALKKYKSQLFNELVIHKKSGGTETAKGGNNV